VGQATKFEMRGYTPKFRAKELASIDVSQRLKATQKIFLNFYFARVTKLPASRSSSALPAI
jgi:hypothetical protein